MQDGQRRSGFELLAYPDVTVATLAGIWPELGSIRPAIVEQLEIDAKYRSYVERQEADVEAYRKDEALVIPVGAFLRGDRGALHRGAREARARPSGDTRCGGADPRRDTGSRDVVAGACPARRVAAQRVTGPAAQPIFGPEEFRRATGVPRGTLEQLERYAEHLVTWQKRLNLVAPSTIPDLWRRHMLDSAQLYPLIKDTGLVAPERPLVDLGSGAGFPGLVLSIMGIRPAILVESDSRKCAFLREAIRVSEVNKNRVATDSVDIFRNRIENSGPETRRRDHRPRSRATEGTPCLRRVFSHYR